MRLSAVAYRDQSAKLLFGDELLKHYLGYVRIVIVKYHRFSEGFKKV
jgi:hypothetical protein